MLTAADVCVIQIPGVNEESAMLLSIPPDRIGHGVFLDPDNGGTEELVSMVTQHHIPIGKHTVLLYVPAAIQTDCFCKHVSLRLLVSKHSLICTFIVSEILPLTCTFLVLQ